MIKSNLSPEETVKLNLTKMSMKELMREKDIFREGFIALSKKEINVSEETKEAYFKYFQMTKEEIQKRKNLEEQKRNEEFIIKSTEYLQNIEEYLI